MSQYKIVRRILKFKKDFNLSYRDLAKLLDCKAPGLHYILNRKSNLAFEIVEKFETLLKRKKETKKDIAAEDEAWGDSK